MVCGCDITPAGAGEEPGDWIKVGILEVDKSDKTANAFDIFIGWWVDQEDQEEEEAEEEEGRGGAGEEEGRKCGGGAYT